MALPLLLFMRTEAHAASIAHAVLRSDDGFSYVGDAEVDAPAANRFAPANSTPVSAIVMKIPGIPGSSTLSGYAGSIDIYSLAFGVSVTYASIGGGSASKPVPTPVTVQKGVDAATGLLELAVFDDNVLTNYPTVSLLQNGFSGYVTFGTLALTYATVTADTLSGSSGSPPAETTAFGYQGLRYCVSPQNADGSLGSPACATFNYATESAARPRLPRTF